MSVDEITEANEVNRRPSACMPLINLEEMQSLRASDDSRNDSNDDDGLVSPKTLKDPPDLIVDEADPTGRLRQNNNDDIEMDRTSQFDEDDDD